MLSIALLGADFEPFDSLNIAAPLWLGCALLFLAWTGLRAVRIRNRTYSVCALLLAAACIALGVLLLRPLWAGPSPDPAASAGPALTAVSFNVQKDNPRPRLAARWIEDQNADLVVLLEAAPGPRSVRAALASSYPYQYDCRGDGLCSTVILARTPARSVTHHASGDSENRRTLSAVTARFDLSGTELSLTAVHLARPWPLGRQALWLRQLAAVAPGAGKAHLLAGDFNNVPWTFAMNRLAHDMDLALLSRALPTWPAGRGPPLLPIDNIYGSPCIAPLALVRGPAIGSDHRPLRLSASLGRCDA